MHTAGVAVDQQSQQYRRVMRGRAAPCVLFGEIAQIKALDHFDNKARQMVTGQPFIHRGWQ